MVFTPSVEHIDLAAKHQYTIYIAVVQSWGIHAGWINHHYWGGGYEMFTRGRCRHEPSALISVLTQNNFISNLHILGTYTK